MHRLGRGWGLIGPGLGIGESVEKPGFDGTTILVLEPPADRRPPLSKPYGRQLSKLSWDRSEDLFYIAVTGPIRSTIPAIPGITASISASYRRHFSASGRESV